MVMMTAVSRTNTSRSWRWTVVRGDVVREKCFSAALDTPSRRSPPTDVCWYKFRLFCSVSRHLGWPLIDTGLLSESSAGLCGSRSQPLNWSKRPYVAQEIGQRRWLLIWLMARKQDYCVCLSINDLRSGRWFWYCQSNLLDEVMHLIFFISYFYHSGDKLQLPTIIMFSWLVHLVSL